ncbi:hypothetical protein [Methylobacterium nodulans]|uniref:Uncharacterized protein n=1 Tax=Methylobacterium nodulans (strain LMG 21967 / CNCM I-2342 / ORS 2060) TaxID=460265 RepID=B8IG02_METNO|nr:hypothetical protein [Methylobacterium nodulans]ACL59712.1 conserved hypothetical protein [Methylobacterium nodulans ORS 2060]
MKGMDRMRRPGRIVEMGTYGLARYATMSNGDTIWWGSEEDMPDQVALAVAVIEADAERNRETVAGKREAA